MMKRTVLAAVFLMLGMAAVTASTARTQEREAGYVQQTPTGKIDWQDGVATAVGIGMPPANAVNSGQARAMAVRAATVVARRNLLETVKAVQVDSETTVAGGMVQSDVVVNRVQGLLHNARTMDTAFMSDGTVEVTVGVGLHGDLLGALMPEAGVEDPRWPTPDRGGAGVEYTGLLVDARSLGVRPAMSPRIVDEQGEVVYGTGDVGRQYLLEHGLAGYATDPVKARRNPRIADYPLTVRAIDATGPAKTDLVVSDSHADVLRRIAENQDFLGKCRVIILLD